MDGRDTPRSYLLLSYRLLLVGSLKEQGNVFLSGFTFNFSLAFSSSLSTLVKKEDKMS